MARIAILFLFLFFSAAVEGLPNTKKVKCHDDNYPQCYKSDLYCPADCPETCVVDCSSCQAVCNPPPPPRRLKSPPPPYIYSSPPPPPYIYSSPPPPPPYIYASPPPPPPATLPPSPPTPTPSTPTPPTSPPPSSEASGQKKARCKNRSYPHCYGMELSCPSSCPDHCEVDCVTCSPVCSKFTHTFI